MKTLADYLNIAVLAEPWLVKALALALATVALNFFVKRLLRRSEKIAAKTATPWDDILVRAARRPLPIAIWLFGIALIAKTIRQQIDDPLFDLVAPLRDVGIAGCLAWFLLRLIGESSERYISEKTTQGQAVDQTSVDAFSKLGRLIIVIIMALMVMQTLGFSIAGILAAGGIGGIAIGFAAKDLLANFFGGLTIYLDRPFSVGEWIRSPDKDIEGTVEAISWRHTRIRGFNKNPIYVPNALFTTIVIENPTRMSHRRIKETIGIRYQDIGKMSAIVADVKKMLAEHPEIDETQTLIVNFNAFADSSLNFFIYTFTKTVAWVHFHAVKQDILLRIADIIASHGAEIAFPTHTLHIDRLPPTEHPI